MGDELNLNTPEEAKRALASIHTRVNELGGELGEHKDAMVADISSIQRTLAEWQNKAQLPSGHAGADEREFATFVHAKANGEPRIQWVGALDENTKEFSPGLVDGSEQPINQWHERFQELCEQRSIVKLIKRPVEMPGGMKRYADSNISDRMLARHMRFAPASLRKALGIDDTMDEKGICQKLFGDASTTGAEFIPDVVLPLVERQLMSERRLEALVDVLPMSGNVVKLPYLTTGVKPYIKLGHTSDDPAQYASSTPATTAVTFTATGLAVRMQVDEDASEDTIIDSQAFFRQIIVEALVDGTEDAIVNSDSSSTHADTGLNGWNPRSRWGTTGLGGTTDHRRAWIGLREDSTQALSTYDASAKTYAAIAALRAKLDSPLGTRGKVIFTPSPEFYLHLFSLDQFLGVDKMGPKAVNLTGALGEIAGMAVVPSDFVDKEYNASGIYDNSTKTKTGALVWNAARYKMGMRRSLAVEAAKDITRGSIDVVGTRRCIFQKLDGTTVSTAAWGYNIAP